jgi:hypothetical protein
MFCLLCPVLPVSLGYQLLIGSSVFTQCSVCCAQCYLCLLVISYWLARRFSYNVLFLVPSVTCVPGLSFLDWPFGCHHVLSVVPSIACVSWLWILDWSFSFHTMFCLLCPVLPVSLGYQLLIGPSVFTQCSVCFVQCCLCLLIISYCLALRFSHNVLSVVPSVACVSWLSVID